MDYKVVMTADAEEDLDRFISNLLFEKRDPQAAGNVLDDFELTKQSLSHVAGALRLCDHPRLNALGYRRMHFLSHRFFMLYRIVDDTVIIDSVFHELQDYENSVF